MVVSGSRLGLPNVYPESRGGWCYCMDFSRNHSGLLHLFSGKPNCLLSIDRHPAQDGSIRKGYDAFQKIRCLAIKASLDAMLSMRIKA